MRRKEGMVKNLRIGVLLSGGVDSAVALYTLKEQGHEVIAYHMKTMHDEFYIQRQIKHKVCCSPSDTFDAQIIADQLKVPLRIIHLQDIFKKLIIDYYLEEYKQGKTPNPCYFCNRLIKFGYLMDLMLQDNVDFVSSGHYARIIDGKLYKAVSKEKDQSYFLASIERERLKKIVFPNGDKTKDEIRKIAKKANIHVHDKTESQDLCFIPDSNQLRFFEEFGIDVKPGPILDKNGKKIGEHTGLVKYTIGQRKIGISTGEKSYVIKICAQENTLIVGNEKDVYSKGFSVRNLNILTDLEKEFVSTVKVRKNSEEVPCAVTLNNDSAIVKTDKPIFAVTPGQAAVFYKDEMVLASGIIDEVL
ncbi:MAG TPA: tRNA 2-thiouridine(34) synthase MnmA [Pseudothermotoga sp.]